MLPRARPSSCWSPRSTSHRFLLLPRGLNPKRSLALSVLRGRLRVAGQRQLEAHRHQNELRDVCLEPHRRLRRSPPRPPRFLRLRRPLPVRGQGRNPAGRPAERTVKPAREALRRRARGFGGGPGTFSYPSTRGFPITYTTADSKFGGRQEGSPFAPRGCPPGAIRPHPYVGPVHAALSKDERGRRGCSGAWKAWMLPNMFRPAVMPLSVDAFVKRGCMERKERRGCLRGCPHEASREASTG